MKYLHYLTEYTLDTFHIYISGACRSSKDTVTVGQCDGSVIDGMTTGHLHCQLQTASQSQSVCLLSNSGLLTPTFISSSPPPLLT